MGRIGCRKIFGSVFPGSGVSCGRGVSLSDVAPGFGRLGVRGEGLGGFRGTGVFDHPVPSVGFHVCDRLFAVEVVARGVVLGFGVVILKCFLAGG